MGAQRGDGSLSTRLARRIAEAIEGAGGFLPFSRFMSMALYEPSLGYYARGAKTFGRLPEGGSDFVTAPELTPLYGRTLARAVGHAMQTAKVDDVIEFGGGSGALAFDLLSTLGDRVRRYSIVEVSASLRERQRERLAAFGKRVRWLDAWPERIEAVVVGNEVLDAMPVDLLRFDGERWFERGVGLVQRAEEGATAVAASAPDGAPRFAWIDRPTEARPPIDDVDWIAGTTVETHAQARAFVASLAERLVRGAAFFVDYGFPEREYYLAERSAGTLVCHRAHRVEVDDDAPLRDVGEKDITAHVDFTGVALAAQDAWLDVAGYTSQARFLIECGIGDFLAEATLAERADVQKLMNEHEMGELFKVIALTKGMRGYEPLGFGRGDRRHRL